VSGTEATKLLAVGDSCVPPNPQGTFSNDKNELLFSRFKINYNNLPEDFKKGSVLVRTDPRLTKGPSKLDTPAPGPDGTEAAGAATPDLAASATPAAPAPEAEQSAAAAAGPPHPSAAKPFDGRSGPIVVLHTDIIKEPFWAERPWLLD
jgi:tRNA(His) guanylyltransferase